MNKEETITINRDRYFTLEVDDIGENDNIDFIRERLKLSLRPIKEYIEILQEETKEDLIRQCYLIAKDLCETRNECFKLTRENNDLEERVIHQDNKIKRLESVIDKAINLVENNKNKTMYSITGEDVDFEIFLDESDIDELLEILRSKE